MLERRERLKLEDGRELRLLSALEVLEARREAEGLARGEAEAALCANACLLARALEQAREAREKQGRMYQVLGITAGAFLVILLL